MIVFALSVVLVPGIPVVMPVTASSSTIKPRKIVLTSVSASGCTSLIVISASVAAVLTSVSTMTSVSAMTSITTEATSTSSVTVLPVPITSSQISTFWSPSTTSATTVATSATTGAASVVPFLFGNVDFHSLTFNVGSIEL